MDEEDRDILRRLSNSSELTAAHMARLMPKVGGPDEFERRLFELARQGLVEHEELDAAPAVPRAQPAPTVTRYWKITNQGRTTLASGVGDNFS